MPGPRQRRFARPLLTQQFRYVAAVLFSAVLLGIGSATAWAEESIVIDFVRHGQTAANGAGIIATSVPGGGLDQIGQEQAQAVDNVLAQGGPYAGIYASQLIRTQETAAPLLTDLPGTHLQVLPGLNEIGAGIFQGFPQISPAGLLYLLGVLPWTFGLYFTPIPGSIDASGMVFQDSFYDTLQTIYNNDMIDPVLAADGKITDVAFSSDFAIMIGTMMNVKNPDLLLMLMHPLPNGGVVVIQGDPVDGWTLVSWNGIPVPPASLPTELFVEVRDLITAPQMAAYNIAEAALTGDPMTIMNAIRDGVDQAGTTTFQVPLAVTRDLVDAVGGSSLLGGLSTDLTNLLPMTATELPGALTSGLGTILGSLLGDVLTSL